VPRDKKRWLFQLFIPLTFKVLRVGAARRNQAIAMASSERDKNEIFVMVFPQRTGGEESPWVMYKVRRQCRQQDGPIALESSPQSRSIWRRLW
jgi:hypothetical protein